MHEYSICQSLVTAALAEYEKINPPPVRLVKTRVVVGELRQVVPDFLKSAYEMLTKDTAVEGSELSIRTVPICAICKDCQWEGEVEGPFFQCPQCSSYKIETTSGMELFLEGLEIEQPDD